LPDCSTSCSPRSSERLVFGPPTQLRVSPVDAFQHIGHLRRRDRDDAFLRRRPDELSTIKPLGVERQARAPELNPVENVWQYLRQNWLSNRVFENYDAIVDAACDAWRRLIAQPQTITSIGMRDWAHIGHAS